MIKFLMLHHSSVSRDKNPDQFIANNNYHKSLWNFKSSLSFYLGYNYEISSKGKVYQARKDGEKTAACYQNMMNDGRCIHICLDGNFDTEKMTPEQVYALRDLLRRLVKEHGINKNNIIAHRNHANKSCPGINIDMNWIRSLVSVNAIKEASMPNIDNKRKALDALIYLKTIINQF